MNPVIVKGPVIGDQFPAGFYSALLFFFLLFTRFSIDTSGGRLSGGRLSGGRLSGGLMSVHHRPTF